MAHFHLLGSIKIVFLLLLLMMMMVNSGTHNEFWFWYIWNVGVLEMGFLGLEKFYKMTVESLYRVCVI